MIKKIPMRTCVVTRLKCEKRDLIRVVRMPDGSVVVDESSKLNGRGAYLKRDYDVFVKARNTKVLEKILGVTIDDSVYEKLFSLVS